MATANQISYWKMMTDRDALAETAKHNRVTEAETAKHNRITESETYRSNLAKEGETNRSNLANELIKTNTLEETKRSNAANELIKTQANVIAQQQADATTKNAETNWREHLNKKSERGWQRDETQRHNMATEQDADDKNISDTITNLIKGIGSIVPF